MKEEKNLIVYIPELIDNIRLMNDKLYKGHEGEAFIRLQNIIEGIEQVAICYGSIHGSTGNILGLNEILFRVNNVIEGKDYIQLADIFEYEVIEILNEILEDVGNKINN